MGVRTVLQLRIPFRRATALLHMHAGMLLRMRHTTYRAHAIQALYTDIGINIVHVNMAEVRWCHAGVNLVDTRLRTHSTPHICLAHHSLYQIGLAHTPHVCDRRALRLRRCATIAVVCSGLWFISDTSILKRIGPLSTCTAVAVFEMLTEMIGAVELLRLVAFTEFVFGAEMPATVLPIRGRVVGELFAAVAAHIEGHRFVDWRMPRIWASSGRLDGGEWEKNSVIIVAEDGACPGMKAAME